MAPASTGPDQPMARKKVPARQLQKRSLSPSSKIESEALNTMKGSATPSPPKPKKAKHHDYFLRSNATPSPPKPKKAKHHDYFLRSSVAHRASPPPDELFATPMASTAAFQKALISAPSYNFAASTMQNKQQPECSHCECACMCDPVREACALCRDCDCGCHDAAPGSVRESEVSRSSGNDSQSAVPATEFHLFMELPLEMRAKIWIFAMPERAITLRGRRPLEGLNFMEWRFRGYQPRDLGYPARVSAFTVPGVLQANSEARREIQRVGWGFALATPDHPQPVRFDFVEDMFVRTLTSRDPFTFSREDKDKLQRIGFAWDVWHETHIFHRANYYNEFPSSNVWQLFPKSPVAKQNEVLRTGQLWILDFDSNFVAVSLDDHEERIRETFFRRHTGSKDLKYSYKITADGVCIGGHHRAIEREIQTMVYGKNYGREDEASLLEDPMENRIDRVCSYVGSKVGYRYLRRLRVDVEIIQMSTEEAKGRYQLSPTQAAWWAIRFGFLTQHERRGCTCVTEADAEWERRMVKYRAEKAAEAANAANSTSSTSSTNNGNASGDTDGSDEADDEADAEAADANPPDPSDDYDEGSDEDDAGEVSVAAYNSGDEAEGDEGDWNGFDSDGDTLMTGTDDDYEEEDEESVIL